MRLVLGSFTVHSLIASFWSLFPPCLILGTLNTDLSNHQVVMWLKLCPSVGYRLRITIFCVLETAVLKVKMVLQAEGIDVFLIGFLKTN